MSKVMLNANLFFILVITGKLIKKLYIAALSETMDYIGAFYSCRQIGYSKLEKLIECYESVGFTSTLLAE